jgi:NAD(P) transhydrogenase subunit alpha
MRLAVPKEIREGEQRVALVPESCRKLVKAGVEVAVEAGAGARAFFSDDAYTEAGAVVVEDVRELLADADFVVKVRPPGFDATRKRHEAELFKSGAVLLSTLMPQQEAEAVERLAERGVTTLSTDLMPRITRAQAMDTRSSMSSVAGYKAVLLAANHLPKYFPMFMTAAGTVLPARVFVIGAGVAGLQAIATARRLGATVEGTDTRPAAKQEIESLGARFAGVDAGEQAQDAGGYARELSPEFYRKQAELIGEHCAAADVVITTALIGGVKAPKLITGEMVRRMRPGSVIVDLAASGGGNCEWTEPGRTTVREGVTIHGPLDLAAEMTLHGSMLYSRNLAAFVLAFWKDGKLNLDMKDEILAAVTVTHEGRVLRGPTAAAPQPAGGAR